MSELLNAKKTAAALGVSPQSIGEWLASGAITPEIHEGRVIRFNLDNVRAQLAKRAKKAKRETYAKSETNLVPTL